METTLETTLPVITPFSLHFARLSITSEHGTETGSASTNVQTSDDGKVKTDHADDRDYI